MHNMLKQKPNCLKNKKKNKERHKRIGLLYYIHLGKGSKQMHDVILRMPKDFHSFKARA